MDQSRRHFLRYSCLAPFIGGAMTACAQGSGKSTGFHAASTSVAPFIPLWPEAHLAGQGPRGAMYRSPGGSLSHIHTPGLYMVRPRTPNGSVVIIAGGGGYQHIEVGHEAMPAARWLASLGITAAVLLYRLPQEGWPQGAQGPLHDAERALHFARSGQLGPQIDPARVGVMGFSAGGHLMGLAALRARTVSVPDHMTYGPLHPSSYPMMLLYPIVSIAPPFTESRTSRTLLGPYAPRSQREAWSLPGYVTDQAPPLFLAHAADDPIAQPEQVELLVQAYHQHHRPLEHHLFATGGHGFGMGHKQGPTAHWAVMAEGWLRTHGLL